MTQDVAPRTQYSALSTQYSRGAEVLVVGGGPAGAATAALLAQRGHDVLVLEKAAFPREKACAEYLSPGVIDVLDRLGALEAVRAAGAAWPLGMRICAGRSSFLLSYADQPRTALGVPRPIFDQVLLDHARARGARVRERVQVLGAILEGRRVVGVRARSPAGLENLRARFVVAADGLHSAVARSLGLPLPIHWPRRLGLVARYVGATGIDQFGEMHTGAGLYCGLAPVGSGLVNVGLVGAIEGKPTGEPAERYFERRLADLPGVARALGQAQRVTPVRGIGPLARRVRRVAGPGYLLVGDAAGFLDPFTGEGIYRALRGAELAAEAVHHEVSSLKSRVTSPESELEIRDSRSETRSYVEARRAAFVDKERVCLLVQVFLGSPRLFEYVVGHLAQRPQLARRLSGVLGDYQPARPAWQPGFLWSLLKP